MPWISDRVLSLYRELNASMAAVAESVIKLPGILRRIHERLEAMSKSNAEILVEVRATRGFVASLVASQEALRKQVRDALENNDVDAEVANEIDALFDEAKAGAAETGAAIVENNTPTDPVPNPNDPNAPSVQP